MINRLTLKEDMIGGLEQEHMPERARTVRAEEERSALIRPIEARGSKDIADTKGIGQPFKLNGSKENDPTEWTHKVQTFVLAKLGDGMLKPLR